MKLPTSKAMTLDERRRRVRDLFAGLNEREVAELLDHLRADSAAAAKDRAMVSALLDERNVAKRRGETRRVDEITAQLSYHGHVETAA